MWELTIESEFSAAHQLRNYCGRCEKMHGHNWRVSVAVQADALDHRGMALDFKDLRSMVSEALEELDHTVLNEVSVFQEVNPSAENLARYIYEELQNRLHATLCRIHQVTVHESPGCTAGYRQADDTGMTLKEEAAALKSGVAADGTYAQRFRRSVVCVSGGLDSAVTASIAAAESAELYFLHASYGQRTAAKERNCFQQLADFFQVKERFLADLSYLGRMGGSSLTDTSREIETADLKRKGIPSTYVPFRNAHLLAVAVSWAEVIGAEAVYIGAVSEDSSGYPDCRPAFYAAWQRVIDQGTRPEAGIRIRVPVIAMSKAEIVRTGADLGTPFALTWSCYRHEGLACGECDSCALRRRGFQEAGLTDPIPYRTGRAGS
ncbi:MAG: 7-cyano-7-deazaguanine synthase QueC [Acidobacteria bacterium]|nr:7-cyano-7-deazaguanine synthase QueC [Acidobacteriota bacterium]